MNDNTNASTLLQEYVEYNVRNLVDYPNDVKVQVLLSTKTIIVHIGVNQKDVGKIIGKKGKTIDSLKLLTFAVKNVNFNDNRKVTLEILEEQPSFNQEEEQLHAYT